MKKMDLYVYVIDHSIPGSEPRFCVQLCTDNEMIDTADMFTVVEDKNGNLDLVFEEQYDTSIRYFISSITEYLLSVPEYIDAFKQRLTEYNDCQNEMKLTSEIETLNKLAEKLGKKVVDNHD